MAEIKQFKGYQGTPRIPKPDKPVQPNIVSVKDGCPVKYPGCEGIGVRVVHPSNPKAPAQNFGQVVFFVPPHVVLAPGSHETEESYYILRGKGLMMLAGKPVNVEAGHVHPSAVLVRARHREHERREPGGADHDLAAEPVTGVTIAVDRTSEKTPRLLDPPLLCCDHQHPRRSGLALTRSQAAWCECQGKP